VILAHKMSMTFGILTGLTNFCRGVAGALVRLTVARADIAVNRADISVARSE
jgi:hypothetical protein